MTMMRDKKMKRMKMTVMLTPSQEKIQRKRR